MLIDLRMVSPKIIQRYFCKGYDYGEKGLRPLQDPLESKKKNVGNHTFFRDNQATIILIKGSCELTREDEMLLINK